MNSVTPSDRYEEAVVVESERGDGDPAVFAGAALTITVVGLLAGWVPAYRAARLHPARTLTETRS